MHLLPGDPILIYVSSGQLKEISDEELTQLREQFGLNKSIGLQYIDWVGEVVRGNFGNSISQHTTVNELIQYRLPITLHLSVISLIISIIIGIPAGVLSAVRRGTWIDEGVTIIGNLGITIPVFWLGIILVYIFSLQLGWLPVQGYTSPFVDFWRSSKQLIMPVFCLSIFSVSSIIRQTRSSMLEVMRQDYIRTAWSKGLTERLVIYRHALKNGLIPVVTLIGMSLSMVVGGSVLIETVYNIPGLGRSLVTAVFTKDYQVVQGYSLIIASVVLFTNLIVDISYGWFDPRIRYN
jgi:peptide/nickel transport system permease protein